MKPAVAAPPALKEWALICRLLTDGRQAVLPRKGGIDEKGFWVEAGEFMLFPTYFHQNREKVRPEFRDEFDRLLAEAPPEGLLRVDALCRVVEAVPVARPEGMASLAGLHPYTEAQIAARLEFRPKKPLVLLVVQTFPLAEPVVAPMREEYAGCLSWVSPGVEAGALAEPALEEDRLREIAERVRKAVG